MDKCDDAGADQNCSVPPIVTCFRFTSSFKHLIYQSDFPSKRFVLCVGDVLVSDKMRRER